MNAIKHGNQRDPGKPDPAVPCVGSRAARTILNSAIATWADDPTVSQSISTGRCSVRNPWCLKNCSRDSILCLGSGPW